MSYTSPTLYLYLCNQKDKRSSHADYSNQLITMKPEGVLPATQQHYLPNPLTVFNNSLSFDPQIPNISLPVLIYYLSYFSTIFYCIYFNNFKYFSKLNKLLYCCEETVYHNQKKAFNWCSLFLRVIKSMTITAGSTN